MQAASRSLPRVPGSRSLLGAFEGIEGGRLACGWVFDVAEPERRCIVQLRIDGRPVAQAEAGLPRPDLGAGPRAECGFRLAVPAAGFDGAIHWAEVRLLPEGLRLGPARPLTGLVAEDRPEARRFSVNSILRLQDGPIDLDRVFPPAFLERHGVRAAVAYAYVWLLKRPPDPDGWEHYARRIEAGELTLGGFLREIGASEDAARARRAGIDLLSEFSLVLAAASRLPGAGG
ncbi:hypothetical protein [Siccirubricoccus sp. G192]|uniref:hypothetical protein n=1 Tax=Siccirubricoccus sp. G192 TaxID=2849651 RepID=UPI001C2C9B31|nr:hypothetical protein [Siccirubricoccus sp. G192]MBV1799185.1 hypothetical protein [Siccirubricoccus sp. G192]